MDREYFEREDIHVMLWVYLTYKLNVFGRNVWKAGGGGGGGGTTAFKLKMVKVIHTRPFYKSCFPWIPLK